MHIVSLKAENIKALKAVSITPEGNLIEITGKNGAGKSSVLDAIWWALSGAKHIQAQPIRKGETKARIRLDMGELIVERRFTESGSSLTVENAEGARYQSPQAMLDDLLGALCFDPMAFVKMPAKDQFDMLRETLGLDFGEIEHEITEAFDERTAVNRQVKAAQASTDSIDVVGEVPIRRIDTDEIAAKIGAAADHNSDIQGRKHRRETAYDTIAANTERAKTLREEARKLEDEANDLAGRLEEAGPLPDVIDVDELREALRKAQETNRSAELWDRKQTHAETAAKLERQSADLTEEIDRLRQAKADMIASADMPVEGLGFGDGLVTLNDVPFDQASTGQQLRTSVALAMAANPKLKVIRIKQGDTLDEDNLGLIAEMAKAHDYQIWMERVDSSGKVGVVIQDGEVVAVNERAA